MRSFLGIKAKAKGEAGRIRFLKQKELLVAAVMFIISAAIFTVGLILNDNNKGNILTVVAALGIIPMARALTGFILIAPFRGVRQELIDEVDRCARPGSIIYTDVVVTSTERAMGLAFIVITGSKVIMLPGTEKEDIFKLKEYLGGLVQRRGYDYKVTVADSEERFLSLLKASDSVTERTFADDEDKAAFEAERAQLCEAFESLMV